MTSRNSIISSLKLKDVYPKDSLLFLEAIYSIHKHIDTIERAKSRQNLLAYSSVCYNLLQAIVFVSRLPICMLSVCFTSFIIPPYMR